MMKQLNCSNPSDERTELYHRKIWMKGRTYERQVRRKLNQLNEDLTTMEILLRAYVLSNHLSVKGTSIWLKPSPREVTKSTNGRYQHSALLILKQRCQRLRFISAALKVVTDLERIGDQAAISPHWSSIWRAALFNALGKITCMRKKPSAWYRPASEPLLPAT